MTPDNISTLRKGRIGHSKSKNGCLTCKIRRVKCGEEKPQCDRCTKTGRRCEYKIVMGHDFRSWSHDSSFQSPPLLAMGSRPPGYLDSIELRAFEYFFARGMTIFPGATNSRFWKTCVLQACHEEPVIWDAVIALSALFENPQYSDEPIGMRGGPHYSLTIPVKDRTHQQALTWYNRSLSKLRTSVERGTANNVVALISCILYICIELLQDNVTEVLQLYHRGVGIISNCNAPLLEECIAPLFYHFSAIAMVTDYISPENAIKPVSKAPDHFSNLEEAEVVLYRFLAKIMTQIRASAQVLLAGGHIEEHRIAELEARNNVLRNVLDQWMWSFQALGITLEGDASYAEKFTIAKLLLAHATLRVALVTSTSRSAMVNDDLIDDFEDILYYARYGIMATRYADGTQPPFSLETSFALSLYICATQCRDYRIRHEALDLLPEVPKVQGLCKSVPHVLMATKVVRIEEAGLELQDRGDGTGLGMFVPESHRICNVAFASTKNENGEHVWVLKYNRSLPDGAGGYRIVEELSPFDSSDDWLIQRSTLAESQRTSRTLAFNLN